MTNGWSGHPDQHSVPPRPHQALEQQDRESCCHRGTALSAGLEALVPEHRFRNVGSGEPGWSVGRERRFRSAGFGALVRRFGPEHRLERLSGSAVRLSPLWSRVDGYRLSSWLAGGGGKGGSGFI